MSERNAVFSPNAPKPVGPYSQAVDLGDVIFCSGQIGLDPATGLLDPDDAGAQARRALSNLAAVLGAAGVSLASVVKTTIFLTDMADFAAVNAVYGEHFTGVLPARTTIGVAALPLAARVEIDAVAIRDPVNS